MVVEVVMNRRVLALDYGTRRIGVAVTDEGRRVALARGVVVAADLSAAFKDIRAIIRQEHVERIIVGLPLKLSGGEGKQAAVVREFGEQLQAASGLPVEYVDERFTSHDAARIAAEKGTESDAEAARLILQTWLDKKRTSPPNITG